MYYAYITHIGAYVYIYIYIYMHTYVQISIYTNVCIVSTWHILPLKQFLIKTTYNTIALTWMYFIYIYIYIYPRSLQTRDMQKSKNNSARHDIWQTSQVMEILEIMAMIWESQKHHFLKFCHVGGHIPHHMYIAIYFLFSFTLFSSLNKCFIFCLVLLYSHCI